jgi:hypothetical protein
VVPNFALGQPSIDPRNVHDAEHLPAGSATSVSVLFFASPLIGDRPLSTYQKTVRRENHSNHALAVQRLTHGHHGASNEPLVI